MRVGIDVREWEAGKMTGIGRYLLNFLLYAAENRPQYSFFLYGNQHTRFPDLPDNVRPQVLRERIRAWWDQVSLPGMLSEDRVDVFLSPYPKGPLFAPCPYLTTVHDLMFLRLPEYRRPLYDPIFRATSRLYNHGAHRVVTDSQHSRKDIGDVLRLPEDRVEVIPIGVSPRFHPRPDPSSERRVIRRHALPERFVLYVGNFKPHKNLKRLLEAFAFLVESESEAGASLVIGGHDQAHRESLLAEVSRLQLDGHVHLTGLVADDDLPALYSLAEVFVTVSLYEGFGLPALEAMSCGTPVIASRVTSLPEVVGQAGRLVDPTDVGAIASALGELLADGDLRDRLSAQGLTRARKFTFDKTSAKLLDLLEEAA